MKSVTLAVMFALAALSTTQATEPTGTLTLTCKGDKTWDYKTGKHEEELGSTMGVVIDFNAGTIEGFGVTGYLVKTSEREMTFNGYWTYERGSISHWEAQKLHISDADNTYVTIDRVTGNVEASYFTHMYTLTYWMQCKPTQRMF